MWGTDLARRKGGNSATATFLQNGDLYSDRVSRADKKINTGLHNVRLDYTSSKNLSAGVDYTFYNDPTDEVYRDFDGTRQEELTGYKTFSRQHIHRVLGYVNHSENLGEGWNLFVRYRVSALLGVEQQRLPIERLFRPAGKPVVEVCPQIQHPTGVCAQ
ncbi:hypothetical protein [Proteiniphilum sp.]|uniref:hypothetical protein n=1 Tax=Proteiniphilum sp. TaxID=1926877 RepID=UPI00332CDF1B